MKNTSFHITNNITFGLILISTGVPTCNAIADLVFLIDSSSKVTSVNYTKMKGFVSEIAKTFDISPLNSRVAVISYSDSARTDIYFTDHSDWQSLKRTVDDLDHLVGGRRIDRALRRAYWDLFAPGT